MAHLMFGIIAIAASQIWRMLREKEEWDKNPRQGPPEASRPCSNMDSFAAPWQSLAQE
jgi:hypothetical protein